MTLNYRIVLLFRISWNKQYLLEVSVHSGTDGGNGLRYAWWPSLNILECNSFTHACAYIHASPVTTRAQIQFVYIFFFGNTDPDTHCITILYVIRLGKMLIFLWKFTIFLVIVEFEKMNTQPTSWNGEIENVLFLTSKKIICTNSLILDLNF